jgi:hypothetical protein
MRFPPAHVSSYQISTFTLAQSEDAKPIGAASCFAGIVLAVSLAFCSVLLFTRSNPELSDSVPLTQSFDDNAQNSQAQRADLEDRNLIGGTQPKIDRAPGANGAMAER